MNIQAITIPLTHLVLSQTPMQQERRKHRTAQDIKELADTMASVGQLHPIIVRPFKVVQTPGLNGVHIAGKTYFFSDEIEEAARNTFEIVAGEGRYLAAEVAGIDEIRAEVRDLSDEQVEVIQLIENLRRKGVHELVEAEGYEALLKRGHTVDEIVAETGATSKSYVYARMKLLALCPDARKAFRDGKVTASIALLLARIPVEALQKQALKEVLDEGYEPMSYREALDYVHREFTFRLDQAGFPTSDAALVPAAGACSACPKRTGNQPELFADIKRGDVCTDPVCFKQKRAAVTERKLAEAKASGQRVIEGKQAEKIAKYGTHSLQEGFVKLDQQCYDDPKSRTYRQLLGKKVTPTLLVDPQSGQAIEVIEKKDLAPVLKERGVSSASSSNPNAAREKKARQETEFRMALFLKVREASAARSKSLTRIDLEEVAGRLFERLDHDTTKRLAKALAWPTEKSGPVEPPVDIGEMTDPQLAQFIRDCVMAPDLYVSPWSTPAPGMIEDAATDLKIDTKKVRQELTAAKGTKPKPTAKTSTKKKAARKKK